MLFSRGSIQDHIERWQEKGLISPQTAAALREEAEDHATLTSAGHLARRLSMMGVVLLAAGVLMFVSANWEAMSRLMRLALMIVTLWGLLFGAVALQRHKAVWLSEGVLLLAAVVFGANIWLVAQMYHLHGNYLDAILLWGAGALLIGLLLNGQVTTALSIGLLGYWGTEVVLELESFQTWFFAPLWLVAMLVIWRNNWRMAIHVALLAAVVWLPLMLAWLLVRSSMPTFAIGPLFLELWADIGVVLFAVGMVLARGATKRRALLNIVSAHGAAYAVLAVIGLQHLGGLGLLGLLSITDSRMPSGQPWLSAVVLLSLLALLISAGAVLWALRRRAITSIDALALGIALASTGLLSSSTMKGQGIPVYWLLSLVVLLLAAWLVAIGTRLNRQRLARIGQVVFALEVLLLYVRAFGGLLQTSLFLLGGGVLLVSMALVHVKLHRFMSTSRKEGAP